MIEQHIITDTDTLQGLANDYLGDPSLTTTIIDYNNLDYPYIITNKSELDTLYASGYLRINRASYRSAVVLRAGSSFLTAPSIADSMTRTYKVVEDTQLAANDPSPYVYVRSEVLGSFGNILAGSLTTVGAILTDIELDIASVTNDLGFTNGKDINVKLVGDLLFIPVDDDTSTAPKDIGSLAAFIEDLGQIDFLMESGAINVLDGDFKSVSGLDNIVQAINARLMTEKGELPLHPEYGTGLPELIGKPQLPYINKLIELDIIDALSYEDRISDVSVTDITLDGTSVLLDITFKPAGIGADASYQSLKLVLDYKGGTS